MKPMGGNSTLEYLRRVIKNFMRNYNVFLSFDNWPLSFWKALACPLHGECSLTLLVSQFQESEILIQVGVGEATLTSHSELHGLFCYI